MVPTWIKRLVALFEPRRPRVRVLPFSPGWLPFLEPLPFYTTLDEDERERLRQIASVIIHNKYWEGCGGLSITDEIRVTIAAQAALLLLNLDSTIPGIRLYVLQKRGVFKTTKSRRGEYSFAPHQIDEIEYRLEALKPYMKV